MIGNTMKLKLAPALIAPLLFLTACGDEAEPEADTANATGGEAAGEVLGGTISDDMLPLEELTSTSPPAERTTVTTQTRSSDGGQTTVETTTQTVTSADGPAEPEPPETPAVPE
jgi:hypothetical protein